MIAYASRTGTRRNLGALRAAGWRLMISPAGELRTEGFERYSIDNGAWTAHTLKQPWDEQRYLFALEHFGARADFVVVPDIVLGGLESLDLSLSWLERVASATSLPLIAVQNGMTPSHLAGIIGPRVGIFIGGDDPWKEATAKVWSRAAHAAGAHCHMGRVNTRRRLKIAGVAGVDSFDGSGASRYEKHLRRMERWLRQPTFRLQMIDGLGVA
jgi:hypothetical protein